MFIIAVSRIMQQQLQQANKSLVIIAIRFCTDFSTTFSTVQLFSRHYHERKKTQVLDCFGGKHKEKK